MAKRLLVAKQHGIAQAMGIDPDLVRYQNKCYAVCT